MATTSKLSFRARNLDANKPMCIFYPLDLTDLSECAPIARAVAQMPTGMEKEEEMESHLQDAIQAQQASTSGVRMDNHVIPTPKVLEVDQDRFNTVYPPNFTCPKNHYIKVQAWLSLDKEEPDYDVDSEDELWLSERHHIEPRALEKIFDALESRSSDNHIILPDQARSALTSFDETVVDDVYDYWLTKREKAMKNRGGQLGVGGLIPRIRTECRRDAQGALNPYVAFRRRAEKMQTRKNRKNDEDSYEKVLKLGHDLRKTVTLFDMVKRREKTKLALIDLDADMLTHRMALSDFGANVYNQFVAKCKVESSTKINGTLKGEEEQAPKKKVKRRKLPSFAHNMDREVPSKAWLKKNAEVWNRPPSMFNPLGVSPVVEVEQSAQAACDANLDGRYTFKRRRGCIYRAPRTEPVKPVPEQIPLERRFYPTTLPSTSGAMRPPAFVRRRIGRGGRTVFDRIVDMSVPRVPNIYDPFDDDFVEDSSVSFLTRLRSEPETDEASVEERRWNEDFQDRERIWLASAKTPPPHPAPSEQKETVPDSSRSGNGSAGRVDRTAAAPLPHKVNVAVGNAAAAGSDEWREPSGSPSESNSSAEWTPPSLGSRMAAFNLLATSEEDARTGEHPAARQPPIKESLMGVGRGSGTVLGCPRPYMIAPAPIGS